MTDGSDVIIDPEIVNDPAKAKEYIDSNLPKFEPPPEEAPRKRGAPKGNQNALKHGFYSRYFKAAEIRDLDHFTDTYLLNEMALLRVIIRRFFLLYKEADTFKDKVQLLEALSLAASRLSRVTSINNTINDPRQEILDALNIALKEVNEGMTFP